MTIEKRIEEYRAQVEEWAEESLEQERDEDVSELSDFDYHGQHEQQSIR